LGVRGSHQKRGLRADADIIKNVGHPNGLGLKGGSQSLKKNDDEDSGNNRGNRHIALITAKKASSKKRR